MQEDKHLISYRPDLSIEKQYHTDGTLPEQHKSKTFIQTEDKLEDILEQTKENLETAKIIATRFPEEFKPAVDVFIKTLEFIYVHIDEEEYVKNKPDTETGVIIEPTEKPDYEGDLGFKPSQVVDSIRIKNRPIDKVKVANDNYYNALLDIVNSYYNRFREISSNYFMRLGMVLEMSPEEDLSFAEKKYEFVPIKINKDLYHINDFIVRSQIQRDQLMRMNNKLFNSKASITHMKACESAKETLLRYLDQSYNNNENYGESFSNIVLKNTIVAYEEKLDYNLLQLYRYLKSSANLLEKTFEMYLDENQAKVILMKKEGIKL